jgi:E3 ubiquitin-protein ligase SIAH1
MKLIIIFVFKKVYTTLHFRLVMSDHTQKNKALLFSEIEDTLECPVCFTVPDRSPIFQCPNGHIVCKDCKARIDECPTCRQPIGNLRNLIAEKIIEKIPARCPFFKHGCPDR